MFSGCWQGFSRMFSACSPRCCGPGGQWWNLMIISNETMDFNDPKELDDPNYLMLPAIRWSPAIWWSPAIQWSIGSMDFDNPKVYGDTSIADGLVLLKRTEAIFQFLAMRLKMHAIPNFSTVPTVANFRETVQSAFKQYICKSGVVEEEAKFQGK